MKYVLITQGGQFSAHHILSDKVPDKLHFYLGRIPVFGTSEGTWLVYKRAPYQDITEGRQLYEYQHPVKHYRPEVPDNIGDHIRFH